MPKEPLERLLCFLFELCFLFFLAVFVFFSIASQERKCKNITKVQSQAEVRLCFLPFLLWLVALCGLCCLDVINP